MKLFLSFFFTIHFFFVGFSSVLMASRPAAETTHFSKKIISDSVFISEKIEQNTVFLDDSIQNKEERIPEKPKKNGLGMMIGGAFLTLLGIVFGVALLLTFLLGFTIGSAFYFRDIYTIAGIMLAGLVIFGVGIFMITRGRERWRAYKRYKKAIKKIKKER